MCRVVVFTLIVALVSADYHSDRKSLLEYETESALGGQIVLNEDEEALDKILMGYKNAELQAGFDDPSKLLAAEHFFTAKAKIEKSPIFKFIHRLPKGALLHAHDTAMASEEYVYNLTYWDGLLACVQNDNLFLNFRPNKDCGDWKLVKELRANDPKFDAWLQTKITLTKDTPHIDHPHVNAVWSIFMDIFAAVDGMLTYEPVFRDYFRQVLQELHEDNVNYVEFRGLLPTLYNLSGKTYGPIEVAGIYADVLKKFKESNPDFYNARFIYAPLRNVNNETVTGYLQTAQDLKRAYPDFIAGFDLVGQEDLGNPLIQFVDALKNNSMSVFYHAGETNWNGASSDLNILDAILLKTKRIGHAYAIIKHPAALKYVKANSVAIEVSPISNQVLRLVSDLRNHPASFLLANNYPVVISSDDPSFWGAKGLSYDWYYAFMGFTSWESGLKTLKQLALNSLQYSTISGDEKARTLERFFNSWNDFVKNELKQKILK